MWVLQRGVRAAAPGLFRRNKPRQMKIFQLKLCCAGSPGCVKSGEFCGLLSRVILTYSGDYRAGHPKGRSEALSEKPAVL